MNDPISKAKKTPGPSASELTATELLPFIPPPSHLWGSLRFWLWTAYIVLMLAAIPDYFVQYWFNVSLGFKTIFWTNFNMQVELFLFSGIITFLSIYLPFRVYAESPTVRNAGFHFGLWIGIFAGWRFAHHYLQFLLAFNGVPFGQNDSVFGNDIGYYIYSVPAWQSFLATAEYWILLGLVATVLARYDQVRNRGLLDRKDLSFWAKTCLLLTPWFNWLLYIQGVVLAAIGFFSRYGLLTKDNEQSGVRVGAEFIDVQGLFSYVNNYWIGIFVTLALSVIFGSMIASLISKFQPLLRQPDPAKHDLSFPSLRPRFRWAVYALALELLFYSGIVIRDHVLVSPNEPYIQKAYIQQHMDSTLNAYKLSQVQPVEWVPPTEPHSVETLLASRTIKNAPILPGWVSYIEEPPDVQHLERIEVSDSLMVFGPMLQIFNQQQQLRPYYHFTSVDNVRYRVNGDKKMFVSAVRELPSLAFLGPKEWLRYWGSAALMFTHGMGLVMSPVDEVTEIGLPNYVSYDVPPKTSNSAFEHEPRIYFGEGAKDDYVLTDIQGLKELDYPTEQFRAEFKYPTDSEDGIRIDSTFRRLIFALHTKDLTAFLFSNYIDESKTRIHIRRTPVLRASSIAPFLFCDTNSFAFIADQKVKWMLNGLTVSNKYPYSFREILGDKADERAVEKFDEQEINYGEDSVKVVMDAFTGAINFYKITNEPIVSTWANVYPDLFTPREKMPESVSAQLTYPLQWFHVQFDDIYKRYHQRDPIEFYNVEDIWDDADETLGSIGRGLSGFGTTDQMTFSYEGYHLLVDPADLPAGVKLNNPQDMQYAMLMPFTCEGCRNLRSVVMAFQDPENYGKLVSFQIPQGLFVPGPEQIDAYVDNDRPVHQQITMWIRHNSEVIRGSTLLLPVKGDLIYVEPIWVNSLQNELPQIKIFAVRYHDRITSGLNVQSAISQRVGLEGGHLPPVPAVDETTVPVADDSSKDDATGGKPTLPPQASPDAKHK